MPADKPSLALRRRLDAPPATVFAAWTEPAQLARWFGPGPAAVVAAEADPRVGGRFHVVFRTEDGETHDVSGVYREVKRDAKLVFTWRWISMPERESLVTVELRPDGAGCLLTLTHERFFDEAARDRHRDGWSASLDKLEGLLAHG